MIRLNNVKKTYISDGNETHALRGIDLEVFPGDFIAIMGASGCGKTTLLNILGGMDTRTEGEYFFDDQKVHEMNMKKLHAFRKENVSFVFQNFALISHYTLLENVEVPLIAKGLPKKRRREIAKECLQQVGLEKLCDKLPSQTSGGQQQRCAIARALASGNKLLLADEPTGALDSKTAKEIMELLSKLNDMGRTIILITHDIVVAGYAKKIIHMQDGVFCRKG